MPLEQQHTPQVDVTISRSFSKDPERPEYHRARIAYDDASNRLVALSTGSQSSSRLMSMRSASSLVIVPAGTGQIAAGSSLPAHLISSSYLHIPVVNTLTSSSSSSSSTAMSVSVSSSTANKYADAGCSCSNHHGDSHSHHPQQDASKSSSHTPHSQTLANAKPSASVALFELQVAILTISDRVSQGVAVDRSGPAAVEFCASVGWKVSAMAVVPDEIPAIQQQVQAWADQSQYHLVLTLGGTGFAPRDVTPEAIAPLLHKPAPAVVHQMTHVSLTKTPTAILSRPVAGIRNQTFIMTLPGSPRAVNEIMSAIAPALPHGIKLMIGAVDPH